MYLLGWEVGVMRWMVHDSYSISTYTYVTSLDPRVCTYLAGKHKAHQTHLLIIACVITAIPEKDENV